MQKDFIREYQDNNPEKFNPNILNCKKNEDILQLLDEIFQSFETIENIRYDGLEELPMNKPLKVEELNNEENKIDIEGSRLRKIVGHFNLSGKNKKGEWKEIEKDLKLYIPKLINDRFFIISGNKFFPVFQIVDAECYKTRTSVVIKTMYKPLIFEFTNDILETNGNDIEYKTKYININLFGKKISPFLYIVTKFGSFNKLIDYFKLTEFISIIDNIDNDNDYYYFDLNEHLYLKVFKNYLNISNIKDNSILILSFIKFFKNLTNYKKIEKIDMEDKEFWLKKLGSNFTTNSKMYNTKAEKILISLEKICDPTTQRAMRLNQDDKKDIYSLIRWSLINYNELMNLDNTDLRNKRIRINEYELYPFIESNLVRINRVLASRNVTVERLQSIFNNISIGKIISDISNNKLIRYSNAPNTIDLFSSQLKGTNTGFQNQNNQAGMNIRTKGIHPSFLGKIDVVATSTNDPGSSFTITPFCDIKDTLHFTDKMSVDVISFNELDWEKSRSNDDIIIDEEDLIEY